jgi:hypothetical protein
MNYIESPTEYDGKDISLFLAGGITNCSDWQSEMVKNLKDLSITIINPRRKNFSVEDINSEEEQVKWEFENLHKASAISFWFSKETLNPITLLELGSWLVSNKKLFIGIHPDYIKKVNLITQIKFARTDVEIVYSLEELIAQIKNWVKR